MVLAALVLVVWFCCWRCSFFFCDGCVGVGARVVAGAVAIVSVRFVGFSVVANVCISDVPLPIPPSPTPPSRVHGARRVCLRTRTLEW